MKRQYRFFFFQFILLCFLFCFVLFYFFLQLIISVKYTNLNKNSLWFKCIVLFCYYHELIKKIEIKKNIILH